MRRAGTTAVIAVMLVLLFAWQSLSQPGQGFGPVYDATNQALRVNTVAGGAAGGTSSNFNQAMPTAGTAAGFRTAAGLMASASITNNNALLIEHFGNVTDTALNAIRVNNVGTAGGGTSSNFGTAFPTAGTAIGFRATSGGMASASITNNNGLLVDLPGSIANTSLNALRTTPRQLFNTTLETTGTMLGVRNGSGLMASASVTNTSALLVTLRNTDGSEVPLAQDGTFNSAVGTTGPLVGFRTAGGLQASASITNNNGLLVEHYGNVTDTVNNALRVNLVVGTVTIASFSYVNLAKVNNDTVNVGVGSAATGTQRVAVASDSQGNAGINQAIGTRMDVAGGRGSGNAVPFVRCDQFASVSTANTGNWQIVASASGQNVYVCGYSLTVGVTPVAINFVAGKSALDRPCSDDSRILVPAGAGYAASGGIVNAVSPVPVFWTDPSEALCVNLSNGGQVSGHVTYTRF